MFRVDRKVSAGKLAALTYDAEEYAAATNGVANGMAEVMQAEIGVDSGELQDSVFVEGGPSDKPTIVGAGPGNDPVAEELSVAYLNNFGTVDTAGTDFMEAAALYAERNGLER